MRLGTRCGATTCYDRQAGQRNDELDAGDSGETLCGLPLTYTGRRLPEPQWLWPTCKDCWKRVLQPGYVPRGKP